MVATVKPRGGVPVPPPSTRSKYPWRSMKVGESFLIEATTNERVKAAHAQVAAAATRTGRRFTARRMAPEGGVRVWRKK